MTTRALVVGLGHPDRGDDGVGPAVARAARPLIPADVPVMVHDGPLALIDVWDGYDEVVVIDAVRTGRPLGSIVVLDVGATAMSPWAGGGGTHAFGLEAAVELARALDRLPGRLLLVGVESVRFDVGAAMSEQVADAVERAAHAVADLVSAAVGGGA